MQETTLSTLRTAHSPPPTIHDVPTQLELEARLRRIKKGKAPGPDQIRSEVCAIATPEVAKLLYPNLDEANPIPGRANTMPVVGCLIPAYKGKGAPHRDRKLQKPPAIQSFWKEHERSFSTKAATVLHPRVRRDCTLQQNLGGTYHMHHIT